MGCGTQLGTQTGEGGVGSKGSGVFLGRSWWLTSLATRTEEEMVFFTWVSGVSVDAIKGARKGSAAACERGKSNEFNMGWSAHDR